MRRKNFPNRKKLRREQAEERQAAYDALPLDVKLAFAGKKQRKKLEKLKETKI